MSTNITEVSNFKMCCPHCKETLMSNISGERMSCEQHGDIYGTRGVHFFEFENSLKQREQHTATSQG